MTILQPPGFQPASVEDFYHAKHKTIYSMRHYGGSFVQALAEALAFADPSNAKRLYEAFQDLLAPYAPGGRFHDV